MASGTKSKRLDADVIPNLPLEHHCEGNIIVKVRSPSRNRNRNLIILINLNQRTMFNMGRLVKQMMIFLNHFLSASMVKDIHGLTCLKNTVQNYWTIEEHIIKYIA